MTWYTLWLMRTSSSPCPLKTTAGLCNEICFSATLPISLTLQYIHKTTALAWGMEHKLNALLGMGRERDAILPNPKAFLTWQLAPQALTTPPQEAVPLLWKKNSALMRPERGSKGYCAPVPVLSLAYAFWLNVAKYLGLSSPSELPRKKYSFFLSSCMTPRILKFF